MLRQMFEGYCLDLNVLAQIGKPPRVMKQEDSVRPLFSEARMLRRRSNPLWRCGGKSPRAGEEAARAFQMRLVEHAPAYGDDACIALRGERIDDGLGLRDLLR